MSTTTRKPFTVSMKRNAKSTVFTVTDDRGIVVATKRTTSVGYPYYVVSVTFYAPDDRFVVNVVKRTASAITARRAMSAVCRATLSDAKPSARVSVTVPTRPGPFTFTAV